MFSLSLGMVRATSCRPLASARHLARHGHDVRLLGHRSIDERCGNDGWRFRPFVHTTDYDSTRPLDLAGEMALMAEQLWFSANVARDVLDELDREPADVLLVDAMLIGGLCAGEAAGVPTVALFHAAFSLFRAGPLVEMLAPALPAVAAIRAELGLPPVDAISDVHDRCTLNLVAAPREFEPDMPFPANVTFVGPVLDGPALVPHPMPSMSTTGATRWSSSASARATKRKSRSCSGASTHSRSFPRGVVVTTGPVDRSRGTGRRRPTRVSRGSFRTARCCRTRPGRHARRPGHRDVGTQSRRAAALPAARPGPVLQRGDGRTARRRTRAPC